jgi:hypothetical protein
VTLRCSNAPHTYVKWPPAGVLQALQAAAVPAVATADLLVAGLAL